MNITTSSIQGDIRGQFLQHYRDRRDEQISTSWKLIEERDEKHRALNRQFGYSEPDGSFGVGCKSHVDRGYKRRYDAIEAEFKPKYDDGLPGLHRWCVRNGMTVHECLLIDSIEDDILKALADRVAEIEDWRIGPIEEKARMMVEGWARSGSVGEVSRRVEFETKNHHYAAARCRKILDIKPWDLARQKAILDYGWAWKAALGKAFSNLRT